MSRTLVRALLFLFWAGAPLIYLRPLENAYDLPKKAVVTLFGALCLAAALFWSAAGGRTRRLPAEVLALLGFLVTAGLSLALSSSPAEGSGIFVHFLSMLAWWGVGILVLSETSGLRTVLLALALSASLAAGLGLLQRMGLDHWGTPGSPLALFSRLRMTDAPGSVFGHVNVAAEFVLIGFLAGLGLVLEGGRRRWPRMLLTLILSIPLVFLAMSGTRAAWLGLLVAGGAWIVSLPLARRRSEPEASAPLPQREDVPGREARSGGGEAARKAGRATGAAPGRGADSRAGRRGLVVVMTFLGLLFAFLILDQYVVVPGRGGGKAVAPRERLLALGRLDEGTIRERIVLWSNTLEMSRAHPLLGVGPGNWKIAYPGWARASLSHGPEGLSLTRQPERAHNDPLQLLAETGLAGWSLMSLFFLVASMRLLSFLRGEEAAVGRTILAIVAAVFSMSLAAFPFQDALPGPIVFMLLGAVAVSGRGSGSSAVGFPGFRRGWLPLKPPAAVVTGILALMLVVVGGGMFRARMIADEAASRSRGLLQASRERSLRGLDSKDAIRRLQLAALDEADHAAAREPANYRHQMQRAAVLQELGLWDETLAVHRRCLDLHPNLVHSMLALARLHRLQGQWGPARAHLTRALRILPESPEILLGFGLFHHARSAIWDESTPTGKRLRERDRELARRFYLRSMEIRRHNPDARLNLARLMLQEGRPPPAIIKLLQEARTQCWGRSDVEEDHDYHRLADCARLASDPRLQVFGGLFGPEGRWPMEIWTRVLALSHGRHAEARLAIAMAGFRRALKGAPMPPRSEVEGLLGLVRGILQDDPMNLKALYYDARLKEALGRRHEALVSFSRLLRAVPPASRREPWVEGLLREALAAKARVEALERGGAEGTEGR